MAVGVVIDLIGDADILDALQEIIEDEDDAEDYFDEIRQWTDGYKMRWFFSTFVYDNLRDIEAGCLCSTRANGCICVGMYSDTGSVKELYARWSSTEQLEVFLNSEGAEQMNGNDDNEYEDDDDLFSNWIGEDPDSVSF